MELFTGCVENRNDPLKLGRCQVRILGLHTDDKTILPTADLPWAYPMQPVTSAAVSGIGFSPVGPVPGSWVVVMFRDEDMQQPIMLGTIGGIPQTKSGERALDDSNDSILPQEGILTTSDGTPVTDGSGNPIRTGTDAATNNTTTSVEGVAPTTPVNPANVDFIPTTPPPRSGAKAGASDGIKALIDACDKVGLTTKFAKCALLGIAGGESKWVVQKERYNYNPVRLKQIFSKATPEVVEKYSFAERKGMSREDFFSFFYGPTFRGKNFLGNKTDADGGKYYGRGFIQLTGRGNYERYQRLANAEGLNLDIVNNPDSLDDSIEVSALVAALYIKDRVRNWQKLMYEPGFYVAAKNAVGVNSPDIALVKQQFYEYFLGGQAGPESTNKNATSTEPNLSASEISAAPPDKKEAYTEDRSVNADVLGFTDPSGKYPLRDFMNEADTNRLARGMIEGTCFGFKDATRKVDIPTAGGKTWSQPLSSYNTVYPYNKVMETESGHLMEFDDSPDGERVHLYHRKGSYLEIDPNGSQLNFIVGDGYQIVLRNNNIYVVGSANLTVGGNIRILCQGDAKIEVEGTSDIVLKNDSTIGVATNLTMNVAQDFDLNVGGNFTTHVVGDMKTKVDSNAVMDVSSEFGVKAQSNITMSSSARVGIQSSGETKINAGGNLQMDGSIIDIQNGSSSGIGAVPTVSPDAVTFPDKGSPGSTEFDNLTPPERSFEDVAKFETPDEWATPEGQAEKQKQFDNPTYKAPENAIGQAQEAAPPSGNRVEGKKIDTAPIYSRSDFPPSYKLSKHFKLEHLVEPSVILRDVSLPPSIGQSGSVKLYTKQDLIANLAALAENVCEPIYEMLGPTSGKFAPMTSRGAWCINSGLRNGTNRSEHNKGRAMDFRFNPKRSFEDMWKLAVDLEKILPYNQLILEYRRPGAKFNPGPGWMNWIHISYSTDGNSKMAFTMIDDKTVDQNGNQRPGSKGLFLFGS
jgi:predicted chitinase